VYYEYIPCFNGFDSFDGIHSVHHQAIKPIKTWNIIHTAIDSYIGFILPRTHDTVAATTVYNTPDDGRGLRPKHVEL